MKYDELNEKQIKLNKIAREILVLSRNTLLVNLRFLDLALSKFEFAQCEEIPFATNGLHLFYNPQVVLKNYKLNKFYVTRAYLHSVFHCIFQHMFINNLVNERLWNIACDIAVENCINDLSLSCVDYDNVLKQKDFINELKNELPFISAEKIYRFLLDKKYSDKKLSDLENLFCIDDHAVWYMSDKGQSLARNSFSGEKGDESQGNEQPQNKNDNETQSNEQSKDQNGNETLSDEQSEEQNDDESQSDEKSQEQNSNGSNGSNNDSQNGDNEQLRAGDHVTRETLNQLKEFWEDASQRIQTDLETFSNGRYGEVGELTQNLKEVNRERYDYTEFLKKFVVRNEVMKVNDDEFDYIFYTYGLKLFKKMPLIEPLEYKEMKAIKEFVIAIDTSGSVVGDLVQSFVQKTYNIMKTTESFFSKINVHIIQCDTEIQEHVKITSQEEFDRYINNMTLKGFGGNNEIALFSYVDDLIRQKEFSNLKGMIYLTDGYGIFPDKKPNYDVAFVFINDRYEIPEVPPWVIKLVLEKDEI